jgi:hypothetical protein
VLQTNWRIFSADAMVISISNSGVIPTETNYVLIAKYFQSPDTCVEKADWQRFCCVNNLIETIVGHYNDGGDEALEAMAEDYPDGWKFSLDSNFACPNINLGGGYNEK